MMTDLAIRTEDLSKQYKITVAMQRHDTLKSQIGHGIRSLLGRNGYPGMAKETVWALKDISFEICRGEKVGFIGSNGAGKSTLLKILSRITEPTTGHMRTTGRVSSLLEVGTGFHPELTGRENIFLNGAILGMRKQEIKRKFDEIVAFAETGKFIDTPVKRYSSGMYVRLAFAVAAHLEPEILVVDEVLAVGDAAFQKKCLGKMGDVAKEGRTVLFVSHNMIAVNSLCSRAVWLKDGKIVKDGPSTEVVTSYMMESSRSARSAEEAWGDTDEAPGNDTVRLRRIRVKRADGSPSDPLTMQEPFLIEVDFWNLKPDAQLDVTLHLYTAEGVLAFTTGTANTRPMQPGLFRSVCHVRGDLLNSGQHHFLVHIVKDASSVIYTHESRVSFDILDVRQRQGACFGREPGVVQPVLEWATEYLGEKETDQWDRRTDYAAE